MNTEGYQKYLRTCIEAAVGSKRQRQKAAAVIERTRSAEALALAAPSGAYLFLSSREATY